MSGILVDPQHSEGALREALYAGSTLMLKPATASKKLCEFTWQMIQEAFSPLHPEQAQSELPVTKFSEIISQLKPRFTHSPEAKRFLSDQLVDSNQRNTSAKRDGYPPALLRSQGCE
jgi:hypothetical protein